MAMPIYRTVTAAGDYVFDADWFITPFNVSWQVEVPAGTTVSYEVDTTLDPTNPTIGTGYGVSVAPNPFWTATTQSPSGSTTTTSGNMTAVVRAFRLAVASISGGPIYFKLMQPMAVD